MVDYNWPGGYLQTFTDGEEDKDNKVKVIVIVHPTLIIEGELWSFEIKFGELGGILSMVTIKVQNFIGKSATKNRMEHTLNCSRKSLVILVSIFYFRNAMDVGQNRVHQNQHTTKPRSEVDEESTVYRGYTNPNVQSRSFKILQESLNYSEAPQGNNIELQDTRGFGLSYRLLKLVLLNTPK
jgi:hypothetical protein